MVILGTRTASTLLGDKITSSGHTLPVSDSLQHFMDGASPNHITENKKVNKHALNIVDISFSSTELCACATDSTPWQKYTSSHLSRIGAFY